MNEEFDENENPLSEPDESEKDEKSISSDLIRGHINTIILRSLSDSDKYGYEIIAEIEKKSCGQYSIKQPSLYSALKRLETQGFITSYWGGTAGGGRRKYFSLTDAGKAVAEQNRSEWEYSRTIIDSLISDKDFDFSNPAPSAVNMRVLKETTTRVPSRDSDDSDEDNEELKNMQARYSELLLEQERLKEELSESKAREEYYRSEQYSSPDTELNEEERARYREIIRSRDEIIGSLDARYEELLEKERKELTEKERERYEQLLGTERERLQREQEELLETVRRQYEELIQKEDDKLADEERQRYEEIIRDREEQLENAQSRINEQQNSESLLSVDEREHYEQLLQHQKKMLEEEAARYKQELEEQAALYREREKEIRHQNYLNLINTPPPAQAPTEEFEHFTAPYAGEEEYDLEPVIPPSEPKSDYRSVVNKLYESSIRADSSSQELNESGARAIDGIDFRDIEMKAAQDGIKIVTSGKTEKTKQLISESIVHKGKALFLSALLLFFIIVAEGAVVMGIKDAYSISIAYPCILWGIGLALLLITGLAYANHFGEHSLRKASPALINALVLFVLCVIVALIIALAVNIDFRAAKDLACYVVIPTIYSFGIVVFGATYYMQVKPKNK